MPIPTWIFHERYGLELVSGCRRSGRSWCIELGLLSREGGFYPILRSNVVRTPRFGMSDILDASWMFIREEYWWLFGVSGGFDVGKSSLEMKELFQRQMKEMDFFRRFGYFRKPYDAAEKIDNYGKRISLPYFARPSTLCPPS